MAGYGSPAEWLGAWEIGDVLPLTVQLTSSTGVPADTSAGLPTALIVAEDSAVSTTPIVGPTFAKRTGTGTVFSAGLYSASLTLSGGTYTANKSYIIQIVATVGGVVQVFLQRFWTQRLARHDAMTIVKAAIEGTDSGGTGVANAVSRKGQVTR